MSTIFIIFVRREATETKTANPDSTPIMRGSYSGAAEYLSNL